MVTSVYFSNDNIQIVTGSANGKTIQIKEVLTAKLPENSMINGVITSDYGIKKTMTELWGMRSVKTSAASLVIDSSSILTKTLVVPPVKPAKLSRIIMGEYAEVENFEDMLYDYLLINPKVEGGGAAILSCAAEKSFIQSYVELFDALKIKLECIDIALNCEIKLINKLSQMKGRTAIVAILDKNTLVLTLFVNGTYRFISRSRLFEDRGSQGSFDEISRALSSLIQFNSSEKSGYSITDIFFCGLNNDEKYICDEMTALFNPITAKIFPDSDEVNFKLKKLSTSVKTPVVSDYIYSIGNLIRL